MHNQFNEALRISLNILCKLNIIDNYVVLVRILVITLSIKTDECTIL